MIDQDEWGRDPSVQTMRKVFSSIERAQHLFFLQLQVSFFDERIRRWRERALTIFEKMWDYAAQKGIPMDQESASDIYIFALARVINSDNVNVSDDKFPQDTKIKKIFMETST